MVEQREASRTALQEPATVDAGELAVRALIEQDSDAILVLDDSGAVVHANAAAGSLFAVAADALVGRRFGLPAQAAHAEEICVLAASGAPIVAEVRVLPTTWNGRPAGLARLRDVTRVQRAEAALRASEQRFELAARAANDGLWEWDLATEEAQFSARWRAIVGQPEPLPRISEWLDRVHPEDKGCVMSALRAHIDGLTSHFETEHRLHHSNGTWRWVLIRGLAERDRDGKAVRLAGSLSDVTHRRVAEEQLAHRAFYDPLTNLPNRALFLDRLRHALRRTLRRREHLFAVLFLDIDRFKVINDSLGHMVGDRLLVMIARRLELALRPGDSVARLGGDEFTILLDDLQDVADATRVADRVHAELAAPFTIGTQELFTSASIGIAFSTAGYEKPEDMLRDADTAMYRAKARGRARHALFDTAMHQNAVRLLQVEADLRHALERDEMHVEYQPIVALESGRILGVEALMRWRHPQRGAVEPIEFIPVAEETGLIVPLGRWVLLQACREVKRWHDKLGPGAACRLSVNLSSKQLSQPDLAQQIAQVLDETGLPATFLELEITESAILEHTEAAEVTLAKLKELGVQLSIDDFGTGYSSLSYLQRFPIDTLKIDRSFVQHLGTLGLDGSTDSRLARTIVLIGRNLGKAVIAEGVETPEQLAILREVRCDRAQGYLFSRPVGGDAARALIAAERRW
jgi:diguanylate cyclase (GGDEF)-like protein/PAS domain S-box-containing protein